MESKIQLKYILTYLLFILFQLTIFSPQMVVGINVPIILTIVFDLLNHPLIYTIKRKVNTDTTFIALLLTICSITLILVDHPFIGTSLLLLTIALFWRTT